MVISLLQKSVPVGGSATAINHILAKHLYQELLHFCLDVGERSRVLHLLHQLLVQLLLALPELYKFLQIYPHSLHSFLPLPAYLAAPPLHPQLILLHPF